MSTIPDRSRATAFGLIKEESGAYPVGDRAKLTEQLESDAVIDELAPELVALIPEPPLESQRPRAATPSERAELVIEDLSLSLDNPYLASSLVPPPKRPFPMRRALAIAGGMLAAAGLGAAIQLAALRETPDQASPQKAQSSAGVTAPAPIAVASPRELIAPPRAIVPAPATIAPAAAPATAAAPPAVVPGASDPIQSVAPSASIQAEAPLAVAPSAPRKRPPPPAPSEPSAVAAAQTSAPTTSVAPVESAAMPSETDPVEPTVAPVAVELPAYPSREQVNQGFESVRAALAQCAAGRTGTAEIKATINSNGRIGHALVGGDFTGSAEGSCMAKAVREAQFPPFAEPRLKVRYPFAL